MRQSLSGGVALRVFASCARQRDCLALRFCVVFVVVRLAALRVRFVVRLRAGELDFRVARLAVFFAAFFVAFLGAAFLVAAFADFLMVFFALVFLAVVFFVTVFLAAVFFVAGFLAVAFFVVAFRTDVFLLARLVAFPVLFLATAMLSTRLGYGRPAAEARALAFFFCVGDSLVRDARFTGFAFVQGAFFFAAIVYSLASMRSMRRTIVTAQRRPASPPHSSQAI